MVSFAHDALELWYATPDAPAPDGTDERRDGISVTVGVRPASPSNSVLVRYRVDEQRPQTLAARLVSTNYQQHSQYFRAQFPTLWSGQIVDYVPVVSAAGGRAPDPATVSRFPTSFRLSEAPPVQAFRSADPPPEAGRFPFETRYLATKHLTLEAQPTIIGQTPSGFVLSWFPTGGTVEGPALRASVVPGGEHQAIIRPDGVGILSVTVTLETDDHAFISVSYSGTIDLGPDGAERARTQRWPINTPVRSAPRLLSSDPKYSWLNRLQCLGVGVVRVYDLAYSYDLYAI